MTLRTVSSSRSAYGFFAFDEAFFDTFTVTAQPNTDKGISCRVLAKVHN
jgi:hypothetical protein